MYSNNCLWTPSVEFACYSIRSCIIIIIKKFSTSANASDNVIINKWIILNFKISVWKLSHKHVKRQKKTYKSKLLTHFEYNRNLKMEIKSINQSINFISPTRAERQGRELQKYKLHELR